MASTTAQINVRLDRELKEAGDRGLARRGISPSQAVRALWRVVGTDDKASQKACDVLLGLGADDVPSEAERQRFEALDSFENSRSAFLRKLASVGVDFSLCAPMTEEEVLEARYEYLLEKSGDQA